MNNDLEYAKFSFRITATFIDVMLLILLKIALSSVIRYYGVTFMILIVAAFITSTKYQGTPGKIFLGLKVTDSQGNQVSVWRAILRYSIYPLFNIAVFFIYMEARIIFNPYPELIYCAALASIVALPILGYLMILFTERNQSLHDKIAGTIVVCVR